MQHDGDCHSDRIVPLTTGEPRIHGPIVAEIYVSDQGELEISLPGSDPPPFPP